LVGFVASHSKERKKIFSKIQYFGDMGKQIFFLAGNIISQIEAKSTKRNLSSVNFYL